MTATALVRITAGLQAIVGANTCMRNTKITVIGAGHLGSAIIGGLIASGHPPTHIWATRPSLPHLEALKERFGIHVSSSNLEGAVHSDVLILATKPQFINPVLLELSTLIAKQQPLIISVAAGVMEAQMRNTLTGNPAIVRAMPNTPALVRSGATTLFANAFVSAAQKQLAEEIFNAVGHTVWLDDEQHIYTVTALSGSGPAYFFLLMEALQEAAVELGLPANIAKTLTIQTALGSARMAQESREELSSLRTQVASKGGGTERALNVLLESGKFHKLVFQAVAAAQQRYQELAFKTEA